MSAFVKNSGSRHTGAGITVTEALRDLANAIEREKLQFPELEPPRRPVRVK
jgi:hypothetical protein